MTPDNSNLTGKSKEVQVIEDKQQNDLKGKRMYFELSEVRVIEGKISNKNGLKGKRTYFELAGGSSCRGFELSGVDSYTTITATAIAKTPLTAKC